jgi:hypothetical protein
MYGPLRAAVLGLTCSNRLPNPLYRLRQPRKHPTRFPSRRDTRSRHACDTTPCVITVINFNDKPAAGCKKVHDVPVANEHLAAERNAQLVARYFGPTFA